MSKLVEWLIPEVDEPEPEVESISNKRFIFMTVVGSIIIVASKVLLQ